MIPLEDYSNVRHLIVFVHGLTDRCTQNKPCHGSAISLALFQAHEQKNSYIFFSRANLGVTGYDTFINTIQGIEVAGTRLANELDTILRNDFKNVSHLSLIGASLGGLFSKYAMTQLLSEKNSIIIEKNIKLHAFITLATPHLGVYDLKKLITIHSSSKIIDSLNKCFSRCFSRCFGSYLHGISELFLDDDVLENLTIASNPILKKFTHRVAYAPLIDDNIVPWCTSALSVSSRESQTTCHYKQGVIKREYTMNQTYDTCAWIKETDPNSHRVIQMAKLLHESPWIIVDVDLSHKHLATLYPQGYQSREVASHVLKWLEIND